MTLRERVQAFKEQYESRIAELEVRVVELESQIASVEEMFPVLEGAPTPAQFEDQVLEAVEEVA